MQYTGPATLDEPVHQTLLRDIRVFQRLLISTLGKQTDNKEWDLWGPLLFSMLLAVCLSFHAINKPASFAVIFALTWLGQGAITSNIKLLGGTISYFHALSVTGYSLFPILISAAASIGLKTRWIRLILSLLLVAWAVWSAQRGLKHAGVKENRLLLAVYPLGLFYTCLGWIVVVS